MGNGQSCFKKIVESKDVVKWNSFFDLLLLMKECQLNVFDDEIANIDIDQYGFYLEQFIVGNLDLDCLPLVPYAKSHIDKLTVVLQKNNRDLTSETLTKLIDKMKDEQNHFSIEYFEGFLNWLGGAARTLNFNIEQLISNLEEHIRSLHQKNRKGAKFCKS